MANLVSATIVVGEPDQPYVLEQCDDCGFDAVLTFPLHMLTPFGVSDFGQYKTCGRCAEEAEV